MRTHSPLMRPVAPEDDQIQFARISRDIPKDEQRMRALFCSHRPVQQTLHTPYTLTHTQA